MEKDPVHFNFCEGPNGTVAMGLHFVGGGPDRTKRTHRFALNLLKYLESEAMSQSFEVVNGEDVAPSTFPTPVLHD